MVCRKDVGCFVVAGIVDKCATAHKGSILGIDLYGNNRAYLVSPVVTLRTDGIDVATALCTSVIAFHQRFRIIIYRTDFMEDVLISMAQLTDMQLSLLGTSRNIVFNKQLVARHSLCNETTILQNVGAIKRAQHKITATVVDE